MNTQEKRRQRFEEKVFAQRFLSSVCRVNKGQFGLQSVDCPTKDDFVAKDAEGNYLEQSLNSAWWAWNAALDDVSIDLSRLRVSSRPDFTGSERLYVSDILEICESNGLKVKV